MRYLYKQTGTVVESGIALDPAIFVPADSAEAETKPAKEAAKKPARKAADKTEKK